ncbi:hypothetical protein HH310_42840 [Actinoplanes sp. TBRC 11911]|uniref:hypothetical protein n=1 Tax=Actinoplanes sp. TBRC 11911 TaxID=2729386 RepID=UPI00145E6557|nr:hypothetical protein [Actinoplanes sp. TBRC 11911]NMO57888.1 hypothetical protein [Actinoplanes sp. TBRC 11911]
MLDTSPRKPANAGPATVVTTTVRQRPVEHAAWAFYLVAAAGSSVGQIWVAVETPPWPHAMPWWFRVLLVLPFAIVIDLGGVVTAAFADTRRRLGEPAYSWRILSAASVTVGVAINVLGHRQVPYFAAVFGGLGAFAYSVWTLHSAARRRDALRAAGKLVDTGPVYGISQWCRQPTVTRRARALALEHGYAVRESLVVARKQLLEERRTTALGRHIQKLIRAQHQDPTIAEIAATTLDVSAIAARLTESADIGGWARVIGADLTPPLLAPADLPANEDVEQGIADLPKDILRRIPVKQPDYDQWRLVWEHWQRDPKVNYKTIAQQHSISERQAQWVRVAGANGLLNSPTPPLVRFLHILRANGHRPLDSRAQS